jgi:hypothetical protein
MRAMETWLDDVLAFAAVGFAAQLADSALGMGFGVLSSSILLAQGVPPPLVSATVNAAKLPTGLMATVSHALNGNLDRRLALRLGLAGAAGGVMGALLLAGMEGILLTLLVSAYLVFIAALLLIRAVTGRAPRVVSSRRNGVIGLIGGLIEGIGGSWGPVVTTALVGNGSVPRLAIGSSAAAETFVSATVFATLALAHALGLWGENGGPGVILGPVVGLVAGGLPAALIGGRLTARVPQRPLMIAIALLAGGIGLARLAGLL